MPKNSFILIAKNIRFKNLGSIITKEIINIYKILQIFMGYGKILLSLNKSLLYYYSMITPEVERIYIKINESRYLTYK